MIKNKQKLILLICLFLFATWFAFFIGIDLTIKTLLLVMIIDYLLGISLAIIGTSKHGNGRLSSSIGYKGLVKKINMMLLVGLAVIIENFLNAIGINIKHVKDVIVVAFIINELISIIENSSLLGLDIGILGKLNTKKIKLKSKDKEEEENNDKYTG